MKKLFKHRNILFLAIMLSTIFTSFYLGAANASSISPGKAQKAWAGFKDESAGKQLYIAYKENLLKLLSTLEGEGKIHYVLFLAFRKVILATENEKILNEIESYLAVIAEKNPISLNALPINWIIACNQKAS